MDSVKAVRQFCWREVNGAMLRSSGMPDADYCANPRLARLASHTPIDMFVSRSEAQSHVESYGSQFRRTYETDERYNAEVLDSGGHWSPGRLEADNAL